MLRIIPVKSITYGAMCLRAGLHYALPLAVAEEIVNLGMAYFEGDDPPFAEADLARFETEYLKKAALAQRHAALVRAREETARVKAEALEGQLEAIEARTKKLKENRAKASKVPGKKGDR